MATYRDERGSGRTGLIVGLLALLFAGGFFILRGHQSGPAIQRVASEPAPRPHSAPPSTPKPCSAKPGAAGLFTVHFDFDKSDIRDEDLHWLNDAANAYAHLTQDVAGCEGADVRVRLDVVGHADTAGARDYNQSLSERRAAEVTRALVRRNVPENHIDASGVGEGDLAVPTPDNTPNAENRRAGVKILIEVVTPNS